MMARRAIPLMIFAILAAILLWPLATGKVLVPAPMLGRMSPWDAGSDSGAHDVHWNALTWDGVAYFYPARKLLAGALNLGELPLWNPYQMCGVPFLASPQSAVLYPPNQLFAFMPVDITFGVLAYLHLFAAGSFTYLFLRKLNLGTAASTFGGVAFMLSGWTVTWLQLPVLLASGVWLPLTLYLITIAWERRSAVHAGLAGVTIALSLLGGHPQIWLYGLMASGLYCVFLAITGRNTVPLIQCAGLTALMLAVGFLLAAPQLLPTMELASLSHRGGTVPTAEGFRAYNALAMPLRNLIGFLIPDFSGNPTRGNFWGTGEYAEFCGYLGILPLMLVPFAFLGWGRKNAGFFGFLAALALLMATGTVINRLFYFEIPGFSRSGSPARALYLYTFALSVLGAMGLDRLLSAASKRGLSRVCLGSAGMLAVAGFALFHANAGYVQEMASVSSLQLLSSTYTPIVTALAFFSVGLIVLLIATSGRIRASIVGWIAVGLLSVDLLAFGIGYNLYSNRSQVYPESKPLAGLRQLAGDQRVMPMNDRWRLRGFPNAVLPPNAATAYGLLDVQGYDSLYPVRYKRLLDAGAGQDSCPPENGNMVFARDLSPSVCNLLGVRYFISSRRSANALELSDGCYASENKGFLPRAFLVHRTRRTSDHQALEMIARGEVDLRSVALTDHSVPVLRGSTSAESGSARVRGWTCNSVAVYIDNRDAPALLVLTDQYYPGWTARIDSQELPVVCVDYCFRGVSVPKGRHLVVFSFEPRSFRNGLRMACFGLLVVIGAAVGSGLRLRRGGTE